MLLSKTLVQDSSHYLHLLFLIFHYPLTQAALILKIKSVHALQVLIPI